MNRHQRRAAAKLQRATPDAGIAAASVAAAATAAAAGGSLAGGLVSGSADLHSDRGIALRAEGKIGEAIAAFRRAVELQPRAALYRFNLGALLHEYGRLDDAIEAYRAAIDIQPDFAEALTNLGAALRDKGLPEEAVTAHRQAIKLKPGLAAAHANLGAALNDQGKLVEAEAAYRRAIALQPDFAAAHGNLGAVLMELGRLPQSRAALERAVSLAPRNVKHRYYLGELEPYTAGDRRLVTLEQIAQNAAQLSADARTELHFALGKAYDDLGQHAKAFAHWKEGNALKRRHVTYNERAELAAFDRIRAVFTPELLRARQFAGHPSSAPVFVIGMPRSGTTLIEQILASHPHVFGAGELNYFERATGGMRPRSGTAAVFPEAVREMTGEDFCALGARYVAEIEKLAPKARRVVDKMPGNFKYAGLIHLALPNAAILHTIRDPADTCLSCFSKSFIEGQNYTYDLAELGRYYRHYQSLMAHWHACLPPGRILDIRYEDVVADLEGQAKRIIAHCQLTWDRRCLAFHQTERPILTASAAQVRQPIYNSGVGRWRMHEEALQPLLAELRI